MVVNGYDSRAVGEGQRDRRIPEITDQPAQRNQSVPGSVRDPALKNKVKQDRAGDTDVDLWPLWAYVHTCTYTNISHQMHE